MRTTARDDGSGTNKGEHLTRGQYGRSSGWVKAQQGIRGEKERLLWLFFLSIDESLGMSIRIINSYSTIPIYICKKRKKKKFNKSGISYKILKKVEE